MASRAETSTSMAFVIRFWREQVGAASRWRGRIEHVQSGQRRDFLYLGDMLRFLQQMGVALAQRTDDDEHETSASQGPG